MLQDKNNNNNMLSLSKMKIEITTVNDNNIMNVSLQLLFDQILLPYKDAYIKKENM